MFRWIIATVVLTMACFIGAVSALPVVEYDPGWWSHTADVNGSLAPGFIDYDVFDTLDEPAPQTLSVGAHVEEAGKAIRSHAEVKSSLTGPRLRVNMNTHAYAAGDSTASVANTFFHATFRVLGEPGFFSLSGTIPVFGGVGPYDARELRASLELAGDAGPMVLYDQEDYLDFDHRVFLPLGSYRLMAAATAPAMTGLEFPVMDNTAGVVFDFHPVATPEPGTWLLFGTGLLGLCVYGNRRRRLKNS